MSLFVIFTIWYDRIMITGTKRVVRGAGYSQMWVTIPFFPGPIL